MKNLPEFNYIMKRNENTKSISNFHISLFPYFQILKKIFFISIFIFFIPYIISAQTVHCKISGWQLKNQTEENGSRIYYFSFDDASYPDNSMFPVYTFRLNLENYKSENYFAEIVNPVFDDLKPEELAKTDLVYYENEAIVPKTEVLTARGQNVLTVSVIPFRYNSKTAKIEALKEFDLKLTSVSGNTNSIKQKSYAQNSVLATGKWFKIKISQNGVYRLTFDQLRSIGISNPQSVRIFGNASGLLSYKNSVYRPDDLTENKITVDQNSVIFYAAGPDRWDYNSTAKMFVPVKNIYSDYSCYFLTSDVNTGFDNAIPVQNNNSLTENINVNDYNSYAFHDENKENLTKSGRVWYGEIFDIDVNQTITLNVPNVKNVPGKIKIAVAAGSAGQSSSFTYSVGDLNKTVTISPIYGYYLFANRNETVQTFTPAAGNSIDVNIKYNKLNSGAKGWLDYIYVNTMSDLNYPGKPVAFRNLNSVSGGNVSKFTITNAAADLSVWDITNPTSPVEISGTLSGSTFTFKSETSTLHEFFAFSKSAITSPDLSGDNVATVENQNLHSVSGATDMIIISAPEFLEQANRLKTFREQNDGLRVFVATPQQIYNEFSSGSPDVSALRDFARMVYKKASGADTLKYLLLFGDGSYDNTSTDSWNTNYVLTYQSEQSEADDQSYVTDDFFGLLDNNEGDVYGLLDIGVGRIPVDDAVQAMGVVDKIISYADKKTMKDWRNKLCFFADDGYDIAGDSQVVHEHDADSLTRIVAAEMPNFNIAKVYLDAYPEEVTSGGQRYPEVNQEFINHFDNGDLIINYTGHGGQKGLAAERVLTVSDIESFYNPNNYPLFVTATCEFSRFDDYSYVSAGERTLLNKSGGAIALFTTTRLAYISPNFTLSQSFYKTVFNRNYKGEYLRLGDIIRITKNKIGLEKNTLIFTLLGDPSMKLNIPEYQIAALTLNGKPFDQQTDTVKSLSKITITGEVQDLRGQKMTDFNGLVYPTIYDKTRNVSTLNNDNIPGGVFNFMLRDNIIYRGKSTVKNGDFSFTFITPKDIMQNIDFGKISLYAQDSLVDAAGSNFDFKVGGFSKNYINDTDGPKIELFLNDSNFVSGGICDANPDIFAKLWDESGINTAGSGIGHDIVATVDADSNPQTFVLNDYYVADNDTWKSGQVKELLSNIEVGNHTLSLKVWDVFNNSSTATIDFTVLETDKIILENLINYPNPVVDKTNFYFEHNRAGADMDIEITIYDFNGNHVKTISTKVYAEGYRTGPVTWDGTGEGNNRLPKGMYIYTVKISSAAGGTAQKSSKLLLVK
jgi:hypothetical protein